MTGLTCPYPYVVAGLHSATPCVTVVACPVSVQKNCHARVTPRVPTFLEKNFSRERDSLRGVQTDWRVGCRWLQNHREQEGSERWSERPYCSRTFSHFIPGLSRIPNLLLKLKSGCVRSPAPVSTTDQPFRDTTPGAESVLPVSHRKHKAYPTLLSEHDRPNQPPTGAHSGSHR